jgi:hypothetical protein
MRASHILNRGAIPYHSTDPVWGPSILLQLGLQRAEQEGIAALALFAPQQFDVEIGIVLSLRCSLWRQAFIVSDGPEGGLNSV